MREAASRIYCLRLIHDWSARYQRLWRRSLKRLRRLLDEEPAR
jgi:hypothetical protein